MSKERTVFDVDIKVRSRKWFDITTKDKVVIGRGDYEWLKDEAAKVVGYKNDLERLRDENRRLQVELGKATDEKKKVRNGWNRQKNRTKMLIRILKEYQLFDVYLRKVDEMRERSRQKEDSKIVDV